MKKIELKNVKYSELGSHETACFEAKVFVDGEPFCWAKNDGWGGPTDFSPIGEKTYEKISELDEEIKNTFPKICTYEAQEFDPNLELVVYDLLVDYVEKRKFKAKLGRKIMYYDPDKNDIYSFNCKYSVEVDKEIRKKYPKFVILNSLPIDDAYKFWKDCMAKFCKK